MAIWMQLTKFWLKITSFGRVAGVIKCRIFSNDPQKKRASVARFFAANLLLRLSHKVIQTAGNGNG